MLTHVSRVQCCVMLTSGSFCQPFGNTCYVDECVIVCWWHMDVDQRVNKSTGWMAEAWEAMFDQGSIFVTR